MANKREKLYRDIIVVNKNDKRAYDDHKYARATRATIGAIKQSRSRRRR